MLEGVKVIEYATYMAAPGAGAIMRDWGAEVIKIEAPKGDPARLVFASIGKDFDVNPVFDLDNRGKKSVVVDTSTDAGRDAVRKLTDDADVFLTNVRPGGLERSGLDYESLKARNPKLVYCALTGYGLDGEDADRAGFDIASFWSRSGVGRLTIPKHVDPFPLRAAQGDHTTSLAAVAGINAALLEAARTGKGRLVDVSLLRTGLYTIGSDFSVQLYFGKLASTKDRRNPVNPLMNFFKMKDGAWICVVARQGVSDWPRFARAFDMEHLLEDERFTTPKGRHANVEALVDEMDLCAAKFTKDEFAARLDAEQIAWAPFQTIAEVAEDPQVMAGGAIVETPDGKGGVYKSPAAPVRFPGADDGPKGPGPRLGEHTFEILEAMGYSKDEIAAISGETP